MSAWLDSRGVYLDLHGAPVSSDNPSYSVDGRVCHAVAREAAIGVFAKYRVGNNSSLPSIVGMHSSPKRIDWMLPGKNGPLSAPKNQSYISGPH
jgi:hypothetical protein